MFHLPRLFSSRRKIALTALLVFAVASLMIVAGVLAKRAGGRMLRPSFPPQQGAVLPLGFVPAGVPLRLTGLTVGKQAANNRAEFLTEFKLQLVATGADALTSFNLMAFEFDEKGLLQRVEGWVRQLPLEPGKPAEIALPLAQRRVAGQRLILAVESAQSKNGRWEAKFDDLAKGALLAAANGNPNQSASRDDHVYPPDSGAALCSNGFRRAMALAQTGDKKGVTSYTCDQQEGSFSFTFQGKSLL